MDGNEEGLDPPTASFVLRGPAFNTHSPLFYRSGQGPSPFAVNGGKHMTELPDNPFENIREGSDYLRLTNDCPENGIVLQIRGCEKVANERFGKEEYQWDAVQYTPHPYEKILTESSKGFCTAISRISKDMNELKKKVLHIKWTHQEISRGRQVKNWIIKEVNESDIPGLF